MDRTDQQFTLDELAALVELPRRTIRYYIQIGLVEGPQGAGRAARYAPRHLERLLEIRKWQRAGLSLERIRELLDINATTALPPAPPRDTGTVEVWSHIVVGEGVELMIHPQRAQLSPEAVRALAQGIVELYQAISST